MFYLIDRDNRICDKVKVPFEVHPDFKFVEHEDESFTEYSHEYVNGEFVRKNVKPLVLSNMEHRIIEYIKLGNQFDMIYHLGIDGWKEKIKEIKEKFPKE